MDGVPRVPVTRLTRALPGPAPDLIRGINENLLTTLAACGDVVRNVISCPAPFETDQRRELQPIVQYISKNLKPKTTAYCEVWMGGERSASIESEEGKVEPLYGQAYLPRKFKVGFCYAGDWLIRGVVGEYYPCRGDLFLQTYEDVDVL